MIRGFLLKIINEYVDFKRQPIYRMGSVNGQNNTNFPISGFSDLRRNLLILKAGGLTFPINAFNLDIRLIFS